MLVTERLQSCMVDKRRPSSAPQHQQQQQQQRSDCRFEAGDSPHQSTGPMSAVIARLCDEPLHLYSAPRLCPI